MLAAQLEFWPEYLRHKSKQRLTKIHQYLRRMRKLRLEVQCVPLRRGVVRAAGVSRARGLRGIQAEARARAQEGGAAGAEA